MMSFLCLCPLSRSLLLRRVLLIQQHQMLLILDIFILYIYRCIFHLSVFVLQFELVVIV